MPTNRGWALHQVFSSHLIFSMTTGGEKPYISLFKVFSPCCIPWPTVCEWAWIFPFPGVLIKSYPMTNRGWVTLPLCFFPVLSHPILWSTGCECPCSFAFASLRLLHHITNRLWVVRLFILFFCWSYDTLLMTKRMWATLHSWSQVGSLLPIPQQQQVSGTDFTFTSNLITGCSMTIRGLVNQTQTCFLCKNILLQSYLVIPQLTGSEWNNILFASSLIIPWFPSLTESQSCFICIALHLMLYSTGCKFSPFLSDSIQISPHAT